MSLPHVLQFFCVAVALAQQPTKDWCKDGIKVPSFSEDDGNVSVKFRVAQAPLFSTNPHIGTKLRWLNLYHTALVVVQHLPGLAPKNWTIEFDSVTNVLGADARYCVTEGILWGEAHWSQMLDTVLRLNASSARRIFTDFIPAVNDTAHQSKPLYQLWRVETRGVETSPLVKDREMGDDGRVEEGMSEVTGGKEAVWHRLLEFLHLMPVHYVYDSNAKAYYKVEGNHFPWLESKYHAVPLEGPPKHLKLI
eukprot:g18259.t1